jgi:TM2 domain-containing membrane protein YozV
MKNKYLAALLAFVGGMIGLHKFYLRDVGSGIFYIFLTMMTADVFAVSAILGVIDGMRYLMMPQEEFDRKFNSKYYRDKPSSRAPKNKNQREYYETTRSKTSRAPRKSIIRNNPFKKSGIKKYKEYEIEEAIEDFKKALKIEPEDIALHFNLACAFSLLENKEEAFGYLDAAVQKGFNDFDRINTHDDLAYLRIQPEFDSFRENGFRLTKTQQRQEIPEETGGAPHNDVLLAQLNRLMELRKKGVLTEHEFMIERKKVLAPR